MRTQKIRIKVLIGSSGNYLGYGWQGASDKDPDDTLYDGIDELQTKEYFLTAELPIPGSAPEEIAATVEVDSSNKSETMK